MSEIFYTSENAVHNMPWLQILFLYFGVHVASFTSTSFIWSRSTTTKRTDKYVGRITGKNSNISTKSQNTVKSCSPFLREGQGYLEAHNTGQAQIS